MARIVEGLTVLSYFLRRRMARKILLGESVVKPTSCKPRLEALEPRTLLSQLTPISYDMPNGFGRASGGMYNYWDKQYTGTGSTMTDGALLTGGLGDLTDGVIAGGHWYDVENIQGTGPYVGW